MMVLTKDLSTIFVVFLGCLGKDFIDFSFRCNIPIIRILILNTLNTSACAGILLSPNRQARSSKIELRAIFVPIHLHLSSTNAFPKTPADPIPFASVLKTNIHDIIFGFFPIRLHSVGVIP